MTLLLDPTLSLSDADENELVAGVCRESFEYFVREFWDVVPGAAPLQWNWHMTVLCQELQEVAERVFPNKCINGKLLPKEVEPRDHDTCVNISPGTSKSTICSILFHPWTWTRFPQCRHLCASHTAELVLDLAYKAREVIRSEKYHDLFPGIELKEDRDAVGLFRNDHGGDRMSCTVAGKSPMGFHAHFIVIDDPIDPKKAVSEAELRDARRFMTDVIPSRMVDKSVTPTFLVMQRLHREDPTAVMLEIARSEDTTPVRHFCFPGELYNSWPVYPEEFRARYVDDLMDPVRLPRNVLKGYQARGAYGYAGQYGQQPVPVGGGMFKEDWYNQRVLASPYNGRRVRFWDRASTADGGCYSAGVLMSKGPDQNYYVEHVVHGQWEPDERNRRIRSTALQDRSRYGPSHEPEIVIEDEGGSTGKDANKGLARVLEGFRLTFQKVTGSKDTRAEPWATQLSAGNVFLVEDGTWDVWGYVNEHTSFKPEPGKRLGRYKDQVDASSGAFNRLAGAADTSGIFRVLGARKGQKGLRIVCCSREALANTVIDDHRCLLVLIDDPPVPGVPLSDVEPLHGLSKLLDTLTIVFPDLDPKDYQDCWQEPVHPWARLPEHLVMSPQDGKKFWSFFLRKRDPAPEVLVIVDHGDRRALSAACGVCEVQRIPQKDAVYRVGVVNNEVWDGTPPNSHVCGIVRTSRHLVL